MYYCSTFEDHSSSARLHVLAYSLVLESFRARVVQTCENSTHDIKCDGVFWSSLWSTALSSAVYVDGRRGTKAVEDWLASLRQSRCERPPANMVTGRRKPGALPTTPQDQRSRAAPLDRKGVAGIQQERNKLMGHVGAYPKADEIHITNREIVSVRPQSGIGSLLGAAKTDVSSTSKFSEGVDTHAMTGVLRGGYDSAEVDTGASLDQLIGLPIRVINSHAYMHMRTPARTHPPHTHIHICARDSYRVDLLHRSRIYFPF